MYDLKVDQDHRSQLNSLKLSIRPFCKKYIEEMRNLDILYDPDVSWEVDQYLHYCKTNKLGYVLIYSDQDSFSEVKSFLIYSSEVDSYHILKFVPSERVVSEEDYLLFDRLHTKLSFHLRTSVIFEIPETDKNIREFIVSIGYKPIGLGRERFGPDLDSFVFQYTLSNSTLN